MEGSCAGFRKVSSHTEGSPTARPHSRAYFLRPQQPSLSSTVPFHPQPGNGTQFPAKESLTAWSWCQVRQYWWADLPRPLEQELVSRLLHLHFRDSKTKVSGDALQLMVEFLRIFVVEAAVRGVRQAQAEGAVLVDVDQLEKVLPQLVRGVQDGWSGVSWGVPGWLLSALLPNSSWISRDVHPP
ncbi:centromere protein X isoform X3 [Urocitellus parryii]|uniref:centromere protein X isoform X3 n=1 Tax=Urocitellus parryii TaxID=9999 RepID=UPI000E559829|nr:centromere protein X isoform X3 [Urocitellus parryii]